MISSLICRFFGKVMGIRSYERQDYLIQGKRLFGWRTIMSQDVKAGKVWAGPWPVAKVYQLAKTAAYLAYVFLDRHLQKAGQDPMSVALEVYRNDNQRLKLTAQTFSNELALYIGLLREADQKIKGMKAKLLEKEPITASEAIYGFAAWLTGFKGTIAFGAEHDVAPVVELVKCWCDTNGLMPPREGVYPNNITQPKEDEPEEPTEK